MPKPRGVEWEYSGATSTSSGDLPVSYQHFYGGAAGARQGGFSSYGVDTNPSERPRDEELERVQYGPHQSEVAAPRPYGPHLSEIGMGGPRAAQPPPFPPPPPPLHSEGSAYGPRLSERGTGPPGPPDAPPPLHSPGSAYGPRLSERVPPPPTKPPFPPPPPPLYSEESAYGPKLSEKGTGPAAKKPKEAKEGGKIRRRASGGGRRSSFLRNVTRSYSDQPWYTGRGVSFQQGRGGVGVEGLDISAMQSYELHNTAVEQQRGGGGKKRKSDGD